MAGIRAKYQVVGEQTLASLGELGRRVADLRPVLEDFAGYMVGSVQRNFDAQGRPNRWAPLKGASLYGWLTSRRTWWTKTGNLSKKGREALAGRLILTDTGRLRRSIHFRAINQGVEGCTNVKYAAIHQLGGTTKAHMIYPRRKKALAWPAAEHPVRRVSHPGSRIPARPFLLFQDEDIYGYLYPRIRSYLEGA